MDLFGYHSNKNLNLLPNDGIVNYYGKILTDTESDQYLQHLLNNIQWKNDEVIIYGKRIVTKRKIAWYGDDYYDYTYSKTTKKALKWTDELVELKSIVEEESGEIYNSCLLNLYHDGDEGMSWHSDDEKELAESSAIASVSFGAERRFVFKHKQSQEKVELILEHGTLLMMKENTQKYWLHSLPKSKKVLIPRVNLTFRNFIA